MEKLPKKDEKGNLVNIGDFKVPEKEDPKNYVASVEERLGSPAEEITFIEEEKQNEVSKEEAARAAEELVKKFEQKRGNTA